MVLCFISRDGSFEFFFCVETDARCQKSWWRCLLWRSFCECSAIRSCRGKFWGLRESFGGG
jgi:hypothetical protein